LPLPDVTSFNPGYKQTKGSGTPAGVGHLSAAPCGAARPPHGGAARLPAFHRGSHPRDSSSQGLSVRPCFLGPAGAFDPVSPPQPGGGDLALLHGRYPRRAIPVTARHPARRS
jgi:hypothetical protein